MLSHLKPIQVEILKLFKSHIIKDTQTAFINKTEIQSNFNDTPISIMIHYIEDLQNQNLIEIDWKQFRRKIFDVEFRCFSSLRYAKYR